MHIFQSREFRRDAERDGVRDEDCEKAVRKAESGLIDAALGGGLIKQRIATGNRGAAKGSRAVIFYKRGELAVFLHVFPKSHKASLTKSELIEYLKIARSLEGLTEAKLNELVAAQGWRELKL
ncbi:MAG: type II toxin-antitoxin system RelE/ParE family toxin [Roseiarcus sp.]|uniref:type II toxin-antitoxin system RelE/ParE family toxin n=1 Tax=Roseiarcus sp. TaxID=1969460 RepID=UPI003C4AA806